MSNTENVATPSATSSIFNPQTIIKLITSETSRQTSLLFMAQLSSGMLNALLSAIIARSLGEDRFGVFVFCWFSLIQYISNFFEFGIFAAGARLLAISRDQQATRQLIGALFFLSLILGISFSLLMGITGEFFQPIIGFINRFITINADLLNNRDVRNILLICAPLCLALPLQTFLDQACPGLNRIGALALLRVLFPSSTLVVIGILIGTHQLSSLTAVMAYLIGLALTSATIIILLKPSFVSLQKNIGQIISETRRFGLDIYFGRITTMLSFKLDGILIPLMLGTTSIGFYNNAQKITDQVANLSRSMATTRFKTFANEKSVNRSVLQFNLLFLLSSTIFLILFGPYIIKFLYGDNFAPAGRLVLPFAFAAFFNGLFQPYNGFLSAHGRGGELRNISIIIGLLNVIGLFIVLARFGMMGAAWMVATTQALNFSLHYYYYRVVHREESLKRTRRVTIVDLSNDPAIAIDWLKQKYGKIETEILNKEELRGKQQLNRLQALRAKERDIFLVYCDRLEWQTRRTPMLLFGLLAGAEECWLLDSHQRTFGHTRWQIILIDIPHLFIEAVGSFAVVAVSWFLTFILETVVKSKPFKWPLHNANNDQANNDPVRINFIRTTPTSGVQTGGSNSHITGFTKGAVALGSNLRFISNDAISGINKDITPIDIIEPSSFFNAHRMIFELWNNLTFTRRALKLVKYNRPDFLYQRYSRFSWAGVAISYLTGIPLILEYNGSEVWIGRHWDDVSLLWLLERFENLNLHGSQMIFVVSDVEKKNLIKAGVDANKVFVNPNGVDPDMFKPGVGGAEVRKELKIDDRVVIGFVGTFGPWHGVLALAEAITKLPEHANCHFLLIGEGSLKPNVEKIVASANCQDRVTFTGRLSHKLVPAYLDACDILVSPHVPMEDGSEFFGSPTKLFEYMAMSKPIVASALGQIADVISDDHNGCLLEPGNIEMLTGAILKLATDEKLRDRLGSQARIDAIANYTWTRNAGRVVEAFLARTTNK